MSASWKKSLPLQQLDAVLVKTSLVDYPERVAAACFLRGCNLRCPYCYNTELVLQDHELNLDNNNSPQFVSIDQVIAHLHKRKNVLSGFVISGGEPLLRPNVVEELISEARGLGYKIKIDTNGIFPDKLQKLLNDKKLCPDYIALDVKTSPRRYHELFPCTSNLDDKGKNDIAKKIKESIKILCDFSSDKREFRSVLYPPLLGIEEVQEISSLLPKDAKWFFARFLNNHCLSPDAEKIHPYDEESENKIISLAKKTIPAVSIR